jgi:hypothetical protein
MMCPGCKADMAAATPYCPACFLTPVPRPQQDEAAPAAAEPPKPGGGSCLDPDCRHGGEAPPDGCRQCGIRVRATALTLRFDWGPVAVGTDRPLVVGREDSPIADRLGDYTNISRRHAEIRCDGTTLTVVDLKSTNGTFINDERIEPGTPARARPGDRVRFAARLEALVTGDDR